MQKKEDLIFHLAKKEDWKSHQDAGLYKPESLEEEGFIHCSRGNQVEKTANKYFKGESSLLLIVIDMASLMSDCKFEVADDSGLTYPHIYGPLNNDAVIDKIELEPEESGLFSVEFDSFE